MTSPQEAHFSSRVSDSPGSRNRSLKYAAMINQLLCPAVQHHEMNTSQAATEREVRGLSMNQIQHGIQTTAQKISAQNPYLKPSYRWLENRCFYVCSTELLQWVDVKQYYVNYMKTSAKNYYVMDTLMQIQNIQPHWSITLKICITFTFINNM